VENNQVTTQQGANASKIESIGTIKTVVGEVKAIDASGVERILQAGDKVFPNETIVTGAGALVLVEFANGTHLDLASASQIVLDTEVFNPATAQPKEGELTAEQIQEMIARGEDPTAVTEATAAGAGAGDEGGSSFIVVDFNNTQGNVNSGFETQGIPGPESTTFTELPPVEDDAAAVAEPVPTTAVTVAAVDEDDIFHYFSENELNWGEEFFADLGDFSIYNRPGIGAIDGNTSDSDEGDGDALGDPAGPLDSVWPDINPSAATVSGNLNAAFGADGAGNIVFTVPAQVVTSNGETVQYWVSDDGHTLIGYITVSYGKESEARFDQEEGSETFNQIIFSAEITDVATGAYTFVLYGSVDHAAGQGENDLALNLSYTITDSDGDAAAGLLVVNVDDDSPVIGYPGSGIESVQSENFVPTVFADEDDLEVGNGDGAAGDDIVYWWQSSVTLPVMFGADGPAAENAVQLSPDGIVDQYGQPLSSGGQPLQYAWDAETGTLTGYTGTPETDSYQEVLTISVNDIWSSGASVQLTLSGSLDHPNNTEDEGQVLPEDNLIFNISYTATDFDGDSVSGTFAVNVDDDSPVAQATEASVNEGAVVEATLAFMAGADGASITHVNGVALLFDEESGWSQPFDGEHGVLQVKADGTYRFTAQPDDLLDSDGTDTFSFTVEDGDGDVSTANFTVAVNDVTQTVTLTVIAVDAQGNAIANSQVAEGETAYYKVVASVNGVVNNSITGNVEVVFTNNGTTTNADYTPSTTTVAIGAVFSAAALDDIVADNGETFTVTLEDGSFTNESTYEDVAYAGSVTTTIIDDSNPDTPNTPDEPTQETVTLTVIAVDAQGNPIANSQIAEGETAYYKVVASVNGVVNNSITGNVEVVFTNNGTTTNADYTPSTTTVAIGAVFTAAALNDSVADNGETFTVTLEDGSFTNESTYEDVAYAGSVTTTITDQAPTTAPDSYETNEDAVLTVATTGAGVLGNDSGEGGLTIQAYSQPEHGTLVLNEDGTFTYTPDQDYSGTDSFTYTPVDGNGVAADPVTVNLLVNPVTDTPTVQLSLTPVVSSNLYAADLFNVLSNPDGQAGNPLGFTVTAYKDGQVTDISIRYKDANGVELSPTGFGVAGAASNGDAVEIGKGEKLVVDLDSPAKSVTFQLAWLNNSNETAVYTVRYTDGTSSVFTIGGGSDGVEAPVTVTAPNGKNIDAIEFSTPTTGGRVDTSDYLLHSVSYVAATQTYSVDIVATPTDIDFSESIVSLIVTTPAGVTLSDAQLVSTTNGITTWSLVVDGSASGTTVNINEATGEVTVTGLTLTVPAGYSGDLTVTATAVAQDGTAATVSASDSETVSTEVLPSTAYIVVNTSNTGGGGASGEQQFEVIITNGNTTLAKTATLQDEQGQQDIPLTFDQNVQFQQGQTYTVVLDHISGSAHVNVTDFSITDSSGNVVTLNGTGGNNNTTLIGTPSGVDDETTSYDGVIYNIIGATNPANIQVSNPIGYDVNTENFNGNANSKVLVLDSVLGNKEDFSLDFSDLPLNGSGQTDLFGVVDKINISGNGGTNEDNTVTLTAQDVLDLGSGGNHTVFITGDVQDKVQINGMTASGTDTVGGVTFNVYTATISGTVATLKIESEITVQNF
jgi:hypothetical protein